MKKLAEHRFEDAVVAASVALSATARLEYPTDGDKAACRQFLEVREYLSLHPADLAVAR